ncbi:hypothetical protein SCLCIDRAFT_944003 [Scleroderma citrinum Foug A]|uniref:Uncharacterized protein n=1 Tax=Scleroderma citrinum Foug A TaxID=1036808 RepID=A0A0C3DWE3_9AGAM|nr:hypothetical protein SCLCIDRAFT_944003 [Scleroderma citrinum Foug A]
MLSLVQKKKKKSVPSRTPKNFWQPVTLFSYALDTFPKYGQLWSKDHSMKLKSDSFVVVYSHDVCDQELVSISVPTLLWSRILWGCSGALSRLRTGHRRTDWISVLVRAPPRAIHYCSACKMHTNYDYFYQWFDCW